MARVPLIIPFMAFNKWPQRPCESFSPWKTAGWKNLSFLFFQRKPKSEDIWIKPSFLDSRYLCPVWCTHQKMSIWQFCVTFLRWSLTWLSDLQLGDKVTTWITWQFCLFPKNKGKTPQETSSLNHPKWAPLDFHVIPPWHEMTLKEGKTHCLKRKHLKNGKGKPPQFIKMMPMMRMIRMERETTSAISITKNGGWNRNTPICTSSAMAKHRSGKLSIHPTSGTSITQRGFREPPPPRSLDGYMVTHGVGLKKQRHPSLWEQESEKKQLKWVNTFYMLTFFVQMLKGSWSYLKALLVGGWINPFEKYAQVKMDHAPS